MTHDHDHDHAPAVEHDHRHDHDLRSSPARRLGVALALTGGFMLVEVVAGLFTRSLALLSDAGHMVTDAAALALALWAQRMAQRAPTTRRTYGFRRAETLAACANGIALGVTTVWIVVEAARRWQHPPDVRGGWMLGVATVGLGVNLLSAWVLARGEHHGANTRAALAHVLADAAGSVAAMLAGGLQLLWGWRRADPVLSVVIAVLILGSAWRLVRDAIDVLMEGAPSGVDVARVEAVVRGTPGVAGLHDLHVWTVADGFPAATVHVVLDGAAHGVDVAREVAARLSRELAIEHVTVQPEAPPASVLVPTERLLRRGATRDPA
jgi:cobalt-zinc-cadmium efflux system protein